MINGCGVNMYAIDIGVKERCIEAPHTSEQFGVMVDA